MSLKIDLRTVVAGKNPAVAERIPAFVYRILDRYLHIREINDILSRYAELSGAPFVDAVANHFRLDVRCVGLERLAQIERPIVSANHPLGGIDGIALMSVVGRVHPRYAVPANDFLMNIPNLRPLFVPVDKHGSNWRYFARFIDVFTSDSAIVHFPAGLCSRRRGTRIVDLEWKKAFLTKARENGRTIIPTHIDGANSRRFYRIAQLRARTGWKFNIEMIMLVDEMFRQRGKTLTITFGPPVEATDLDHRYTDRVWADALRRYVYALTDAPTLPFLDYADAFRRG
jgi:putative hemolysin